MIRVYIPFWFWEDFQNGMWRKLKKENEPEMLKKAIEFTGDHIRYGKAMRTVILAWPETMLNSLTNVSINRRAFLGHCACTYAFNCPEYITRMAWRELTDRQRELADRQAQNTIDWWVKNRMEYERKNIQIRRRMEKKMLRTRYS